MKRSFHCFINTVGDIDFLSENTDLIVCGHLNGDISLRSIKSNEYVWENKDSSGCSISTVAVAPNRDIVVGGGSNECLFVINAANGNSIFSVDVDSGIYRVLFLSQQKIACGLRNGTVAIVCWQSQKIERILKVGSCFIYSLAISPVNNDILLTGDGAGVIKQTIVSSEKTVMVYEGHSSDVCDLKFLSCGNMFVSGSGDQTARLFDLDQKQAIRVFRGHTHSVRFVSSIHNDELLISTSYDGEVKVWEIESGECVSTVKSEQSFWRGAVSKDEQSLIVGGGLDAFFSIFSLPSLSLDHSQMIIIL